MKDFLLKTGLMVLLLTMVIPFASKAQTNNYYYQGTIEIEVGETKYIQLPQDIYSTVILGYYPEGKWVLSDNFYNATMISQSLQGCKVRGDKVGRRCYADN